MRQTVLFIAMLFTAIEAFGQIIYENTYIAGTRDFRMIKLQYAGYKYCTTLANNEITLYNLDHTIYKQFPLPAFPPSTSNVTVSYISETLFNTDSTDIEYLLYYQESGFYGVWHTKILDENGNVLFSKDSAQLLCVTGYYYPAPETQGIYNTNLGAKMVLVENMGDPISPIYVYGLPGLLECNVCDGERSTATGGGLGTAGDNWNFQVSPNPTNSFSLVQYQLPKGIDNAMLVIFDMQGQEKARYPVNSANTQLVLPAGQLASGSYLYAMDLPGKGLTTKKVLVIH